MITEMCGDSWCFLEIQIWKPRPQAMKTCEKTNRWQCALALHQGALEASMIRIEVTEMLQRCYRDVRELNSWIKFEWQCNSWMNMQREWKDVYWVHNVQTCLWRFAKLDSGPISCGISWSHQTRRVSTWRDLLQHSHLRLWDAWQDADGTIWDDMGRYGTIWDDIIKTYAKHTIIINDL